MSARKKPFGRDLRSLSHRQRAVRLQGKHVSVKHNQRAAIKLQNCSPSRWSQVEAYGLASRAGHDLEASIQVAQGMVRGAAVAGDVRAREGQ